MSVLFYVVIGFIELVVIIFDLDFLYGEVDFILCIV